MVIGDDDDDDDGDGGDCDEDEDGSDDDDDDDDDGDYDDAAADDDGGVLVFARVRFFKVSKLASALVLDKRVLGSFERVVQRSMEGLDEEISRVAMGNMSTAYCIPRAYIYIHVYVYIYICMCVYV